VSPGGLSVTANMTANASVSGGCQQTLMEHVLPRSNSTGHWWTRADMRPAVFKTVWGRPEKLAQVRHRPSTSTLATDDSQ
jgi:hypothetical protein